MSINKTAALERVASFASTYAETVSEAQETMRLARHDLAEMIVLARDQAKATQQEIADATGKYEDPLSRQRIKQLIDDFREGLV